MPPQEINEQMRELESALAEQVLGVGAGRHAYSRTGHGLKELVYYIADRDEFMEKLNAALADHPPYPIEIEFHADSEWGDFQRLLSNFSEAST